MSKPRHIIVGQHIDPAKLERAKQLRQEMTPAEKQLWARLRRNQLGFHFRRQQIIDGKSEEEIRASWEPGLSQYKEMRKKYLLYP